MGLTHRGLWSNATAAAAVALIEGLLDTHHFAVLVGGSYRTMLLCLVVLSLSSSAAATNRYYGDITVWSPSGRFRIDATSPDNAGKSRLGFQSHFTYKCVDTSSGNLVRSQETGHEKANSHEQC